ncbi:MAG TPA: hypothetical protein PK239_18630 [Chitinophagales bacterium]|nr:hypothetical protein [Chitinophagales bacterium]
MKKFLIFACLFFFSVAVAAISTQVRYLRIHGSSTVFLQSANNGSNPFAWAGTDHNELLVLWRGKNLTLQQQYQSGVNFYQQKGISNIGLLEQQYLDIVPVCVECLTNIDCYLSKNLLNSIVADRLRILLASLENTHTYTAFKQKVVTFEESVIDDTSLSATNRDALLLFSAIAIESGKYWSENPPSGARRWWTIALADAIGGITGFLCCGGLWGGVVLGAGASLAAGLD